MIFSTEIINYLGILISSHKQRLETVQTHPFTKACAPLYPKGSVRYTLYNKPSKTETMGEKGLHILSCRPRPKVPRVAFIRSVLLYVHRERTGC